jgi:indolepyruvate ferredoxin oxidoreductase beta subunit
MEDKITNILLVGVGGQGIILASEIMADVFMQAGYDVKKSEVHGMAQRGGSVNTHVRFGPRVFSPLIKEGEAEIFIAFEELEALRYLHFLSPAPVILLNEQRLNPASVSLGNAPYPEGIDEILSPRARIFRRIPGRALALQAGDARAANIVLLGALQPLLPIAENLWTEKIAGRFSPKARQINLEAFRLGRTAGIVAGS